MIPTYPQGAYRTLNPKTPFFPRNPEVDDKLRLVDVEVGSGVYIGGFPKLGVPLIGVRQDRV